MPFDTLNRRLPGLTMLRTRRRVRITRPASILRTRPAAPLPTLVAGLIGRAPIMVLDGVPERGAPSVTQIPRITLVRRI